MASDSTSTTPGNNPGNPPGTRELNEWLGEVRAWLAALAVLAAQASLQAALAPPGGFWQDDNDGHTAGNPILADRYKLRYQFFFYLNAVSFATSLVVVIMVMDPKVFRDGKKMLVLKAFMVVDLLTLMGVYAAGTCRDKTSTVFVVVLMGLVFLYVVSVLHYAHVLVGWAWTCLPAMFGKSFKPSFLPEGARERELQQREITLR